MKELEELFEKIGEKQFARKILQVKVASKKNILAKLDDTTLPKSELLDSIVGSKKS